MLAAHGVFYLAATAVISGLFPTFTTLMLGRPPAQAGWLPWVAGTFAVLGYALTWISPREPQIEFGPRWPRKVLRLVLAAMAACTLLSLAITAGLAALGAVDPPRLASLRTLALCLLALALAWIGPRLKRAELIWLAYAAIAACTVKLLFEDLSAGSPGAIAFSLFWCGICWLVVPRFARSGKPS